MKVTIIAVAAGAGFTKIPASIPAKFVKVEQDSVTPTETLNVKFRQPDGSLSAAAAFPAAATIRHISEVGPIARPVGYNAVNVPAVAEEYMQINTTSGTGCNIRLYEYENIPRGTV